MTKRAAESKTIWFSIAMLFMSVGTEMAGAVQFMPEAWQTPAQLGLAIIWGVGSVILRLVTHEPVTVRS